jgi:K+ transporter
VLTVRFSDEPVVPAAERVTVEPLGHGFWRVRVA